MRSEIEMAFLLVPSDAPNVIMTNILHKVDGDVLDRVRHLGQIGTTAYVDIDVLINSQSKEVLAYLIGKDANLAQLLAFFSGALTNGIPVQFKIDPDYASDQVRPSIAGHLWSGVILNALHTPD